MAIKIKELNPKTGEVKQVSTFLDKQSLLIHLSRADLRLREAAIFNKACENGELFVCGLKYHISLEDLVEELNAETQRAWKNNTILLSKDSFDKVQELIEDPPAPSDDLRKLMNSKPRYQKF